MPRFRQKPSSRRAARPTASWLVTGPTLAGQVARGERSTHLIPVKPTDHRKRYREGLRLSVKGFVGGATVCHVHILGAEQVQLRDIDYPTARELGHVRVDAFREAWVRDNDVAYAEEAHGDPLERFDRRHAHKWVWLIRFNLDRTLPDRYLAQNSAEGYTESAARGLKDEPPALHPHEFERHVEANRDLTHEQWLALGRIVSLGEKARAHSERGRNMRRRAA